MFKNIKENDYVKKFIELWNVPRYRSIVILGLYILFFAIVIASIKSNQSFSSIDTNKKDAMEVYQEMNNYKYNVTVENEGVQTLIGHVYNNRQIIIFNGDSYYYNSVYLYEKEEDMYIQTDDKLLDFEVWRFTPSLISDLIQSGELESKTEYTNGEVAKTYLVNVAQFIKLYYGDETETDELIGVTLYQKDESITKVEMDLTPVYNQGQFANSYDYKVAIEYDSIGQISPIVVNIESSD